VDDLERLLNTSPKTPRIKDLRGIPCPLNYVRLVAILEEMNPEDEIVVFLDDGEPIQNVTQSVVADGHQILIKEKMDPGWMLRVQKVASK